MTEYRFAAFENLSTPASWVENAINIPQKKYKKVTPFFLRPYVIGAAASVVIVAAVALTLLLSAGNHSPLAPKPVFPVQPTAAAAATAEQTSAPADLPNQGDTVPATELIEETNAAGEVIATYAVPVTRSARSQEGTQGVPEAMPPSTPAGATAPADATKSGVIPSSVTSPEEESEPASLPTAAASAPATTQGVWETVTATNDPCVEDVTQSLTEGAVVSDAYTGSLTLSISGQSPLFASTYVRASITSSDGSPCGSTLVLKPQLQDTGKKEVTFRSTGQLFRHKTYSLYVYDTKGHSATVSFTVSYGDTMIINI